jgi:broad specificity phosphatase PhoE
MDIYFVRHGQTNGNTARRHQHPDTPLNAYGKEQVEAIIGKISALQPTRVITSTQLRAVETARILTEACDVIPETYPEFEELKRPLWLVGTRYIGITTVIYVLQWFFGKEIEGGESYEDFLERIRRARSFLESLPNDSRVLVVSHAVFTNIFIEHLCMDERMNFWQALRSFLRILRLRNAGIIHLLYTPGKNICGWTILKR